MKGAARKALRMRDVVPILITEDMSVILGNYRKSEQRLKRASFLSFG
jgi:hypothetical protein